MEIVDTALAGVKIVVPKRLGDARGFFSEVWNRRDMAAAGLDGDFVQDNHALSERRGTVRGLHYQLAPRAQVKLVRVAAGAVLDVAVDIRRGSPTFGRHVAVVLSAENWRQLWVPAGFAHGYCTLVDGTALLYKTSDFYSAPHDRGIAWDDPALGIDWPVDAADAVVSARDRAAPRLQDQPDLFGDPA